MTSERLKQANEIFRTARDLPPDERARHIEQSCAGDAELQKEVAALLSQYEVTKESANFPDQPVSNAPAAPVSSEGDLMAGSRVGVFKLEREIGRGGMGAVYLAERADGAFRQRVAVKLIKRGMDTDFILRRFRQERQILAALNHPNIAQLLDGGTTDDGLPYFVMDYIEGESLYRYGDVNKLGITDRLRVMHQICLAIDYAHQNKVIHRDIKPSNILVTKNGTPKLLDFGIAKVLNPELSSETLDPTMTAMRMMTPEYASPEQVRGEPATTASDTYSLGVLLYELLTGHRPYRIRSRAPHEVARVICEEEPDRPSASVTRDDNLVSTSVSAAESLEFIYQSRGTSVEELRRALAGDLERIVLKALRKNPAERYQTAAEFAADINRFLEKRPVLAESFDTVKKAKTSRLKTGEKQLAEKQAVAILPFKMLGATVSRSVTDSQEFLGIGLADALITRLSVVKQIVVRPTSSVLPFGETSDPFEAGEQLAVDFVVDGNIRRVGERIRVTVQLLSVGENSTLWAQTFNEKFTDVLELEDLISEKIAASLAPHLTGEEQKQLQKRGTNNAAAYEAYLRGRFHWNQFTPESLPKALDSFQTAIWLDPNYALAFVGLADFYIWANIYGLMPSKAALAEAEQAARRAIEIDPRLSEAYASLGLIMQNRKQWAEAERLQRQAVKLNPNYVHAHEWWAAQLIGLGNFAEGVEEIKLAERLDPLSLRTKTLTAWTLYQAHQFDEALERANEIIELDKNYPQGNAQLGNNLLALGETEKALAAFRRFDQMLPDFALAKYQLCFALVAANRRDEAQIVLEEMKTLAAKTYVKPFFLAMAHAALDERDEAFAYFEQSFDEDEPWMLWLGTEPQLASLHDDARFIRLLERMNNPLARQFKAQVRAKDKPKNFAVLPFRFHALNTGEITEDRFLGLGLTDALITRLSNIRSVIVRPTSAVLRFAEMTDAFQAGRELEVEFVLVGNIRRVGERVRVTAQLLNVNDKSIRWAENFDERMTDVLELEDSISERVAASLVPQLTGEEQKQLQKRGTNNPQAYESYLRGRFYWNLMTEEGFAKAIQSYERAVALDPHYALAYTAIVEYYVFLGIHCVIPFAESSRRAKEAATRAEAIDPTLAETQAALGIVAIDYDFDWQASEAYLRRAIDINPNSVLAHCWYQSLLLQSGRFDEMRVELNCVLELNPEAIVSLHYLAWAHYHTRRFDESIKIHRQLINNEPHYAWGRFTFSWALRCAEQHAESMAQAKRAVELAPENPMYLTALATAFAAAGQRDRAIETLERINQLSATRYVSPFMLAVVYCSLNEREQAFAALEKALAERDVWIVWLGVDPQFDSLRSDTRFPGLLRRTGNPLALP